LRLFALSDIHVDYPVNAQWIADLSRYDFTEDAIILAGDVSHEKSRVETTLDNLCTRFAHVLFIPGNHDIWITKQETMSSIEKYAEVCQLAREIGAHTTPLKLGDLSIVPLHSWYDYSFGQPCERIKEAWTDFVACQWPDAMDNTQITDYFLKMNVPNLSISNKEVITFSHFLPRIDVMPSFIPKAKQFLYPVLGTAKLDKHVRQLKPSMHVYGHSHVNRHIDIDGITYINNAFAYPGETRIAAKKLRCIREV